MYVCMYILSVVVLQIYIYQSCAQIDNNQQVYEAQIRVPRCNSILKAGSHEFSTAQATSSWLMYRPQPQGSSS
jgi:hypothetical protein